MKNIISLFCKHKWKTHAKKEYKWKEKEVVLDGFNPIYQKQKYSETIEIIICEKCGKLYKLNY